MRLSARLLIALLLFAPLLVSAPRAQLWCYDADEVYALVDGSTVTVYHDATVYNCCADPFEYVVIQEPDQILVEEIEILTEPCYCICCDNLWVIIEDVAPGDYALRFSWYDYETFEWQERVLDISVPDVGQGGWPFVSTVSEPGCAEASSAPDGSGDQQPDSSAGSWGTIKALYR